MEKEFIPYEQALTLKELGFREHCAAFYSTEEELCFKWESNGNMSLHLLRLIQAPTFSQAFRWFREKYNLKGFIGFRPNVKQFDCHVYDMSLSGIEYVKQRTLEEFNKDPKVGTYEEAELECLKKLIEIVKTKETC